MSNTKRQVYIVSLGCDKNRVDTENILYSLFGQGYAVADKIEDAHAIIVNTCAFVESARVEAIDTILELGRAKLKGQKLIVTGCLPQKYRQEIGNDLPEVDAFLGVRDHEAVARVMGELFGEAIKSGESTKTYPGRIRTTPQHYAYLRISDGCNNRCTFCTVPSIRGPYVSRTMDSLVDEAAGLVSQGVKELILVAQDVTRYYQDLGATDTKPLVELIGCLSAIDGLQYIRLMYCYPDMIDDGLIECIANNPKVVKYIDMPLQHISHKVLKLMGRKGDFGSLSALIAKLYTRIPDIAIRTTMMVGFPGEGEAEFGELTKFVLESKFRHMGIFAYSREEDTPSHKLRGHVSQSIKDYRHSELARIQSEIVAEYNQSQIGQSIRAVYEDIDYDRSLFVARPLTSAPEVDNLIYFGAKFVDIGQEVNIRITGVDGYDLIGEAMEDKE